MKIKVIQPLADSKSVAEKYISAFYGCSLVEFARQIEKEKASEPANITTCFTSEEVAYG